MLERIRATEGDVSFYYKNLVTGETVSYQPELPLIAASIIKLPMMVEAFRQFEAGTLDPSMLVAVRDADRVPPSGVLTFLHDGLQVTVLDMVKLMIVISDNTATNLLMDLIGIDNVNALLDSLNMPITRLRRKMYDMKGRADGLRNVIAIGEMGRLLELLYTEAILTPESCRAMLDILKSQQVDRKMPFWFAEQLTIAHKTGEDDGTSHDVGIVYAREPFVLCFGSNHVDTPAFDRLIQDMTKELVDAQG